MVSMAPTVLRSFWRAASKASSSTALFTACNFPSDPLTALSRFDA